MSSHISSSMPSPASGLQSGLAHLCVLSVLVLGVGCGAAAPPASVFPDAKSAIGRLDATYANVTGVRGEAKIDYLGAKGRVHGTLSMLASGPSSLRIAITADVVGAAGEVTTDGKRFIADDKMNGRFLVGEAKPCNVALITQVPLPTEELVPMLWGMRPSIPHKITRESISWNGAGYYTVMLAHDDPTTGDKPLTHELHLAPLPEDFSKPWSAQRVRLVGVVGWSSDRADASLIYRVTMQDHQKTKTAKPLVDSEGISDDILPSGPDVEVDVPRGIRVEVPGKKSDVIFKYVDAVLNPPLIKNAYQLIIRPGIRTEKVECE